MRFPRPKITSAHVLALIALFASLGGTVYAAAKIDGKTIKQRSIPGSRLKPNAVTGAQVDEGSLATVPSAGRAATAASATEATKAAEAGKAAEAARADRATEAVRAQTAPVAGRATKADAADLAKVAENVERLRGFFAGDFLQRCVIGTLNGIVTLKGVVGGNPEVVGTNQSCLVVGLTATRVADGEYRITVPAGVFPAAAAASARGQNSAASVGPDLATPSENDFLVKVFSVTDSVPLPTEEFTVVFF